MFQLTVNGLEAKPQRELAEAALVVVAASGKGSETAFLFVDEEWRCRRAAIIQRGRVDVVVMVVQKVEPLGAELHRYALSDGEALFNIRVRIPCARPTQRVAVHH